MEVREDAVGVGAGVGAGVVEDQAEVRVRVIRAAAVRAEEEASVGAIGHHQTRALDTFLAAHPAPCHGPFHVHAVAANRSIVWTQHSELLDSPCRLRYPFGELLSQIFSSAAASIGFLIPPTFGVQCCR